MDSEHQTQIIHFITDYWHINTDYHRLHVTDSFVDFYFIL